MARLSTSDAPRQSPPAGAASLWTFARDIKLSHTIFALPWALLATFLAADGFPRPGQLGLILACMVTARTFAMGCNRLLDARLDQLNPRTSGRALPAGRLSRRFALRMVILCALGFIAGCLGFLFFYSNPWPAWASIPVLAFIGLYPLLKRFTRLCHYYLGVALGLAPLCAWVAIAGSIQPTPVWMGLGVFLWTAGFDILYACQDVDSDRATGVHSIPAALGITGALWTARLTHLACIVALIAAGWVSEPLASIFFLGIAGAAALLVIEHALVRPQDLSRLNLAFFTLNGVISLVVAACGIADIYF